jgi:hypothetical protein
MRATMRQVKATTVIASLLVLSLSLVACNKVAVTGTESSSDKAQNNGNGYDGNNGNGYDGKTYSAADANRTCADNGSHIVAAIRIATSGEAYLTRNNCTTVNPPLLLAPGSYQILNSSTLTYNGLSFSSGTAPTVTFTSPAANAVVGSSVSVSGTCSAIGKIVNLTAGSVNGSATCSNASTWNTTLNLSSLADGPVTLTASLTDYAAQSAQTSVNVSKSIPTATVTIQSSVTAINASNVTQVGFNGQCSDNGQTVQVSVGSVSKTATCSTSVWSLTMDLTPVADGVVTANVSHTNIYNRQGTASMTLNKITQAPTLAITSSTAVNSANVANFSLSGTCSSVGRPVNLSAGSFTATTTCTNSSTWSTVANLSSLQQGSILLTASQTDTVGNTSSANATLTKDTVVPTLTMNVPSGVTAATASSVTINGTCSENQRSVSISGSATATATCTSGSWNTNVNLSSSSGSAALTATQSDLAGNSSSVTNSVTITPVVNIQSASSTINRANVTAFSLSGTCSVLGQPVSLSSGAFSSTASCSNGGSWSATVDLSALADGSLVITASQSNSSGTTGNKTLSLTKDTTAPTVTLTTTVTRFQRCRFDLRSD